jgi:hypothetical protein
MGGDMADDASTELPPDHPGFVWVLDCPCGERLRGESEDEIVEVSLGHLGEKHPDMEYEREHVLFMATKFRKPTPSS